MVMMLSDARMIQRHCGSPVTSHITDIVNRPFRRLHPSVFNDSQRGSGACCCALSSYSHTAPRARLVAGRERLPANIDGWDDAGLLSSVGDGGSTDEPGHGQKTYEYRLRVYASLESYHRGC